MKKRITLNLVCAALGMLTLTDACLAATNAVDTAMVAASFMSYSEHPTLFDSREIDARVATLLKQMTLKEKLGQLTQFSNGDATGPDNVKIDQNELAALGRLGAMLNVSGARACNEIQRHAVEKSHLKIPILFGLDVIHGHHTVYPIPLGLSAAWDLTWRNAAHAWPPSKQPPTAFAGRSRLWWTSPATRGGEGSRKAAVKTLTWDH